MKRLVALLLLALSFAVPVAAQNPTTRVIKRSGFVAGVRGDVFVNSSTGVPYVCKSATCASNGTGWVSMDAAVLGASTGTSLALTSFLSAGTTPATSGAVRLANAGSVNARNAANDGNIALLASDTSNRAIIQSGTGGDIRLNPAGGNTFNLNASGILSQYKGVATAGQGLTAIYASVASTGQTASIGTTNLQVGGAVAPAGLYRVSVYLTTTTTGAGATVLATIGWTDPGGAKTEATSTVDASAANYTSKTFLVRADGTNNITYATTLTNAATYAVYVTLERVQ